MPKQSWIIAGALTAMLLVAAVGYLFYSKQQQIAQASVELASARTGLAKSQLESEGLRHQVSDHQARLAELEKEKDSALQSRQSLEGEMRAALESKDVTISQLQGKLTVSILDRILFDSGEADLKPDGAEVLRKVAAILAQHPTLKVHVVGHTDDVPIRPAARKRFPSNWELSTARATAAVRFLTEQAGVDPRRLGAVGYGEFRPVAENTTPEGRARNRRIAITILSEEMAGADTVASAVAAPQAPPPAQTPPAIPATFVIPTTNGTSAATNAAATITNYPAAAPATTAPPETPLPPPLTQTNQPEAK